MSYETRLIAVFIFIFCMLLYDLKNPPGERFRFKAYSFLLALGFAGALFGAVVDSITSRISIDYFVVGKGLAAGDQIKQQVLLLGAKAGFSGAIFAACCLLVANPTKRQTKQLYSYIPRILAASITTGILFGALQQLTQIVKHSGVIFLLGEDRSKLFTVVWMTHIGIYAGAVFGIVWACIKVRKDNNT